MKPKTVNAWRVVYLLAGQKGYAQDHGSATAAFDEVGQLHARGLTAWVELVKVRA